MKAYERHDISDKQWEIISPLLPGQAGVWGGVAQDNRKFINAVFFILRTGAPWRDLPDSYGKWYSQHSRFNRWVKGGIWEQILSKLAANPDFEWIAIDGSHIKAHLSAMGARGGNQEIGRTKGGSIQKFILLWTNKVCP